MTKIPVLLTLLVALLVCLLPAAPVQAAGAPRTFVSAAGSDGNNCINVATPCRHLAAAYAATASNGEIYVLDPANYGSLTITGSVSIEGHGWASIAPPSGGNAITINANPGDAINIIGVVLDGTALANTNGIVFNSGGSLNVRDSVIRNFASFGINFSPSATSVLSISNTYVANQGNSGVVVAGPGTSTGILDHVISDDNGFSTSVGSGLLFSSSAAAVNFTVSDSIFSGNAARGVFLSGPSSQSTVMLSNVTVANNIGDGISASGSTATIRVTKSTVTRNAVGFATSFSGTIASFGDNSVTGNGSDGSATTTIVPK